MDLSSSAPLYCLGVIGLNRKRCRWGLLMVVLIGAWGFLAASDEVAFQDPGLQTAVVEALALEERAITLEDLASLTTLVASGRGIVDLTGIASCSALERLYLDGNDIADLAPLAGLTSLLTLTLNGNRIVDVAPLAALDQLTSVTLHANQIADVGPLASLTALTSVSVGNLIEDLSPLATLPHLTRLMLTVLPIADLSALAQMDGLEFLTVSSGRTLSGRPTFDSAVLSGCVQLATLRLDGYDIVGVSDLAGSVPSLRSLELHYVGVEDVSGFDAFSELAALTLDGVVPSSEGLDLSLLVVPPSITSLTLENNGIVNPTMLATATQLTQLSLKRNQMTTVESLAALTNLTVLDLSFNPITDLAPLEGMTSLRSLTIQGVPFERTEGSETNRLLRELLERGVNIYY